MWKRFPMKTFPGNFREKACDEISAKNLARISSEIPYIFREKYYSK